MMGKPSSRLWPQLFVVFLAMSLGGVVGYGTGVGAAIHVAKRALYRYSGDHGLDFERPADESQGILAAMNASQFATCSEEELSFFRHLVLGSTFFREAGRMRGGRLVCSTTFSHAELPQTEYPPSFLGASGALIYTNLDPLRIGPVVPFVVRIGDAYVARSVFIPDTIPSGMQFTLTSNSVGGLSTYENGSHSTLSPELLIHDSRGTFQRMLYVTRCSNRYPQCMTFFVPIMSAVHQQHTLIRFCTAAGCAVGGCFGLMSVVLYRRTKGIEQQLRRAIRRNKLQVAYQPIIDLATRKAIGAEALVRWTDEDRLPIPPDIFIKIAEEGGFVNQITKLVVHRVLSDFGRYLGDHPEFRVNVNVAANDLTDPGFLTMLEDALRKSRVSPASLGIEITEGGTARHAPAIKTIALLRQRGHRVYIDDFGTGYSSLAYLHELAVDGIKIDRAFTSAIGTGAVTVGIMPQILSMAETLNLSVVAEGIETEAQSAYFNANAVQVTGQGWLFGRAVFPDEFRRLWMEKPPARKDGPAGKPRRLLVRKRTLEPA